MMSLMQTLTRTFHMTDQVWQKHTNPWSVWTRYSALPLLVLAVWSRVWWGGWAVVPGGVVILWIWLNPRLFPRPRSTRNWASKAVLGERVWLNRQRVPIPAHFGPAIAVTNTINMLGLVICMIGLVKLAIWPTVLGTSWVILGKTWFLDRMVWLYDEMSDREPHYRQWLY